MRQRLRHLLEMIRFSHTVFALPFALLAAVMAWTVPSDPPIEFRFRDLVGILLCMVFARSAAMAFNRLVDHRLDAANPRTANRHLPAGLLSRGTVIAFTLLTSLGFLASTALFWPNRWPLYLAVPVLIFLGGYSFTKRFTSLAHFWLGAALCLAPLCAWIAIRGTLLSQQPLDVLPAAWMGLAILLWVAGFDVIYACQDVGYDRATQLHSIPAVLGVPAALRLAAACHTAMVAVLVFLPLLDRWGGPAIPLGWVYWLGILAVAALLAYEHWLVRPDDLTRVNVAFFHVNAIVSLGLFAITTLDLLWR